MTLHDNRSKSDDCSTSLLLHHQCSIKKKHRALICVHKFSLFAAKPLVDLCDTRVGIGVAGALATCLAQAGLWGAVCAGVVATDGGAAAVVSSFVAGSSRFFSLLSV